MFEQRVKDLRQKLVKEKVDAVLISDVSNITYLSGFTNFSKDEREAYIFIGRDFAYVITDARYSEAVRKEVPHLELFERGHQKSTEDLLKKHKKDIQQLGIEEDNLTVAEFKVVKKHFKKIKHVDVKHLRSIKTKEEIKKIENACKLGDLAFKYILKKLKVGITEKEIATKLENFIKSKGGEFSFPAIVAFGKNTSVPHHQTGETKLDNNDFVLLDFGVKLDQYCSDMTRTVFFGQPSEKQKRIYQTVLTAQQRAIEFINSAIKAGKEIKVAEVDQVARKYIISQGYPAIPHSLGHGVGLEIHEHPNLSPKSKETLKEGMVFSIEPGIYIPNFGSPRSLREAGGVRIEDLFVLSENGLRQLTNSSKEIIVI